MQLTSAASTLLLALAPRHAPPVMGGFEQKYFSKDGARVALLVGGSHGLASSDLQSMCSGRDGVTGQIYSLSDARFEVIAEGEEIYVSREELLAENPQNPKICGGMEVEFLVAKTEYDKFQACEVRISAVADGRSQCYGCTRIEK